MLKKQVFWTSIKILRIFQRVQTNEFTGKYQDASHKNISKNILKTERPAPKESARFLTPTTAKCKTCKQTVSIGIETWLSGAEIQEYSSHLSFVIRPKVHPLTTSVNANATIY